MVAWKTPFYSELCYSQGSCRGCNPGLIHRTIQQFAISLNCAGSSRYSCFSHFHCTFYRFKLIHWYTFKTFSSGANFKNRLKLFHLMKEIQLFSSFLFFQYCTHLNSPSRTHNSSFTTHFCCQYLLARVLQTASILFLGSFVCFASDHPLAPATPSWCSSPRSALFLRARNQLFPKVVVGCCCCCCCNSSTN